MGVSEFLNKHHGKVIAAVVISSAAIILYKLCKEPIVKEDKPVKQTKRRKLARPEYNLEDLIAKIEALPFNHLQQARIDLSSGTSNMPNELNETISDENFDQMNLNDTSSNEQDNQCEDEENSSQDGDDEQEDSEDETDSDQDPFKPFAEIWEKLDLQELLKLAASERRRLLAPRKVEDDSEPLTCVIDTQPLCGSYNFALRIDFSDGVRWLARIPGHGARFGPVDTRKMYNEYQTMELVRRFVSIPVPQVYTILTSCEPVGVPVALIDFIDGRPLSELWYTEMNDQQRLTILSKIAENMVQLNDLKSGRIGGLEFVEGKTLDFIGIGSLYSFIEENDCAWSRTLACGPFDKYKDYLDAISDGSDEMHIRVRGDVPILRIAIDTMPSCLLNEERYPVSFVDFSQQNIIVDDDYNIRAFIDWDGVGAFANVSGNARFPSWLTRDWDPTMYSYDPDSPDDGASAYEHSPEDLARYRQHYAACFASHSDKLVNYDPRMTTLSHVVEAIEQGLSNSNVRTDIVVKMLNHAFDNDPPFTLKEYIDDFVAGDTSIKDAMIKEAFTRAWANEWRCEEELSSAPTSSGSSWVDGGFVEDEVKDR